MIDRAYLEDMLDDDDHSTAQADYESQDAEMRDRRLAEYSREIARAHAARAEYIRGRFDE
jgi:hypothetical protein